MENAKTKFCGTCGANMPETAQFCPKCGAKVPVMPGQPTAQNGTAAPPIPPAVGQTSTTPGHTPGSFPTQGPSSFGGAGFSGFSAQPQTTLQTDLGMNWYKFIIYFALFADALLLVIEAITLFTGSNYGGYASLVYLFFGGLRVFDIIFGLVSLALAAMAIYVRQKLAKFERDAPRLFYTLYIANGVVGLIYLWGGTLLVSSAASLWLDASFLFDAASVIFTTIGIIVGCVIWIAVNVIYFKKRAHLFVN